MNEYETVTVAVLLKWLCYSDLKVYSPNTVLQYPPKNFGCSGGKCCKFSVWSEASCLLASAELCTWLFVLVLVASGFWWCRRTNVPVHVRDYGGDE